MLPKKTFTHATFLSFFLCKHPKFVSYFIEALLFKLYNIYKEQHDSERKRFFYICLSRGKADKVVDFAGRRRQ